MTITYLLAFVDDLARIVTKKHFFFFQNIRINIYIFNLYATGCRVLLLQATTTCTGYYLLYVEGATEGAVHVKKRSKRGKDGQDQSIYVVKKVVHTMP
jgi:hypothetical protein